MKNSPSHGATRGAFLSRSHAWALTASFTMTKRPVQRAGPPRANRLQPRCTEQPRPQPTDWRPSPAKWRPRARRRAAKRRRRGGGAPCTTCGPAKCQQASAEVHRATSAPTCRPAPVASRVEPARWAKGHEAETAKTRDYRYPTLNYLKQSTGPTSP